MLTVEKLGCTSKKVYPIRLEMTLKEQKVRNQNQFFIEIQNKHKRKKIDFRLYLLISLYGSS